VTVLVLETGSTRTTVIATNLRRGIAALGSHLGCRLDSLCQGVKLDLPATELLASAAESLLSQSHLAFPPRKVSLANGQLLTYPLRHHRSIIDRGVSKIPAAEQ
jgi:hypothetical protein